MRPEQYEHHVAAVLRSEGWQTTVTRRSRDMGVDVVAERTGQRMAVQVKLYGASSTKVNAEHVMCLHGAAAYADCDRAMLATDGTLSSEAMAVAEKLGIEVRRVPAIDDPSGGFVSSSADGLSFDRIWERYVEPLAGRELIRSAGKTMQILEVDGSGIRRVTTGGTTQRIAIGTFRWVIDRLLAGEIVTRQEIHDRNARQVSSGVMLILSNVPLFELVTRDGLKAIRMRPGGRTSLS
jgi:hypothetical protein